MIFTCGHLACQICWDQIAKKDIANKNKKNPIIQCPFCKVDGRKNLLRKVYT